MNKVVVFGTAVGVILIGAVIAFFLFFATIVDNGNVGVVYSLNGGVQEQTLGQGFHTVGATDRVIEYPVRTQNKNYESLEIATLDGKAISMPVSLNYSVDPEQASAVYKKFGNASIEDLEEGYIKTRINDALRQTVAKYTVIEVFGESIGDVKNETIELAKEDLARYGIIVEDVMLSAPAPDAETQKAIDNRVAANQELERKKTDKAIAAEEAERKKIEAQGESEANRIVEESLTDKVLQQQLIEKWNGTNPISIGSEGVIVDLPQSEPTQE